MTLRTLLISSFALLLCGCAGFFDKDNTPKPSNLVHFTPEISVKRLWSAQPTSGTGKEYFRLQPAVTSTAIFTADRKGHVARTDKNTGKTLWSINIHDKISAGPSAGDGLVIVGTHSGQLVALDQNTGHLFWAINLSSEIFAPPAIEKIVLIKTIDGKVSALSETDGHRLWEYEQNEPNLILRAASAPKIAQDAVIVGFANGNLAKLRLSNGNLLWLKPIAVASGSFPIQRMIDIDADPEIKGDRVYVATYQGRIAALDFVTGNDLWTHDLSTYTGLAASPEAIYVTDAKSRIWALSPHSGSVLWVQDQLAARNLTAPALMGPGFVLGDGQGYLHWLAPVDGHTIARVKVAASPIFAAPVVDHNIVYVVTADGHLAAYQIS